MVINGVTVAEPSIEGVVVTDEPVWSSNTGRNINGKMVGDIVAYKTTIEVTWNLLTYSQMATIRDAIRGEGFFSITYPDTNQSGADTTSTKTVYASNIPRTLYSRSSKAQYYKDITITFIEQ